MERVRIEGHHTRRGGSRKFSFTNMAPVTESNGWLAKNRNLKGQKTLQMVNVIIILEGRDHET